MNTKLRNAIVASAVAVFFLIIILFIWSQRITKNPPGTVGNTAGNLYNSGLFCEYNGKVYFSNSMEGGSLYCMDPDETHVKKLNEQKVRNILAGGDYLYFFQTGAASKSGFGQVQGMKSFDRCKLNGKDIAALTKDVVVSGQLVDDYLYLLTTSSKGPSFYKMKTDKSDKIDLSTTVINPACVQNGLIYYSGTETNHYLYAIDTSNDTVSEIWKGNAWNPIVIGDTVYYMDISRDYKLCAYSMSRNEISILTSERVDCFNVGYGYIYYQTNSKEPKLKCMRTDGSDDFEVADGIYSNINLTSNFVYFQPFGNDITTYHAPLGGSGFSAFAPQ